MRISQAKECIKELYLNTNSVTALISERGIGKTSAYQQCADELKIGYIGLYAAALEGPDFMGLPDKDQEKGITRYLAPQFLPTRQAVNEGLYPEKGILVIEEINRVPSDTTSVLYPLLLEKRINGHDLAEGWTIGVTMNPDTMNYLVNSLDDAMLDRFIAIEVTADLDDYLEYSLKKGGNQEVLSFLEACPDLLLSVKTAADSAALSKAPTPRGWTKVQELMNNCSLPENLMHELVAGIVGPEAAASLIGYLGNRNFQIPDSRKILTDYDNAKNAVQAVIDANRFDMLGYVIKTTVLTFEPKMQHFDNLNRFIQHIPEEMKILFFKFASARRPDEFDALSENVAAFEQVSDQIVDLLQV